MAALLARERGALVPAGTAAATLALIDALQALPAPALLQLLDRCDAWRRPGRVTALIHGAAALDDRDPDQAPGAIRLRRALAAANRVDQGAIARGLPGRPEEIRDAIGRERLRAIAGAA